MRTDNNKILIVEDNKSNLELFLDVLCSANYNCIHTTHGKNVLEIVKKETPKLILLDIQLPDIDGLEILNSLRSIEETKNIKVVALTAFAMKGDKEKFLSQGFDGYISKPIKIKEFLQQIKEFLM
jgi:two-component system cell cycle response regulator DivK